MKKIFTLFLLVAAYSLQAQITGSDMPTVGFSIDYQVINKNGFNTYSALTGTGLEWDYRTINEKPDTMIMNYIAPGSTTEGGSFPASTVAEAIPPDTLGHFFYEAQAAAFYRNGFYDASNKLLLPYNDKLKLYSIPFQFGTSFTDTYTCTAGTIDISGTVYPATIDNGSYNSDVDGSGILRVPAGYFDNVFRIYYEESFTIKADIGMGPMGLIAITEYGYEYWKAGHKKPLLTYYNTSAEDLMGGTGTTVTVAVKYDKHAPVDGLNPSSVNESNIQVPVALFPNPSSGVINVKIENTNDHYRMDVFDVVGKLSYSQELTNNAAQVDLSALPKGMYCVKVYNDTYYSTGKIVLK